MTGFDHVCRPPELELLLSIDAGLEGGCAPSRPITDRAPSHVRCHEASPKVRDGPPGELSEVLHETETAQGSPPMT